jgi:hypothetical protein
MEIISSTVSLSEGRLASAGACKRGRDVQDRVMMRTDDDLHVHIQL